MTYDIKFLAELTGGIIVGDADFKIEQLSSINSVLPNSLVYISDKGFEHQINDENNVAYIIKTEFKDLITTGIIHDDPKKAFRIIAELFSPKQKNNKIEATAYISPLAKIESEVYIGHNVVIEENVIIETGCKIYANSVIKFNSNIKKNTIIDSNVVIENDSKIGEKCYISSGVVIGSRGFGYNFEGGEWKYIPQLGKVIIGNNVEIGANSCIDRGAIENTIINDGVIIDNLVHIAHNVEIGKHSALAALVGVAGSTKIGKYCMFGGQVGIAGHIKLTDNIQVNGGSTILQSIKEPGRYAGSFQALLSNKWNKNMIYFKKIDELFKRNKTNE